MHLAKGRNHLTKWSQQSFYLNTWLLSLQSLVLLSDWHLWFYMGELRSVLGLRAKWLGRVTGSRFSLALAWLSACLNPSLLILFVVVVGATLMRVKVHVTLNFLNIPMSSPRLWHPSSNGICAGRETGWCCLSFFYHLSTRLFLPSRGYLPVIFFV